MKCAICGGEILGPPYYYDAMTMLFYHSSCVNDYHPELMPSLEVVSQ